LVYSGLGTSQAYSCHAGFKAFFIAAFGLFHFGPFVSTFFSLLLKRSLDDPDDCPTLRNSKFSEQKKNLFWHFRIIFVSFFAVSTTLIGERKRLTLKVAKVQFNVMNF
jgi:hypothetical protein